MGDRNDAYRRKRRAWRKRHGLSETAGRSIGVPVSNASRPTAGDLIRQGYREVKEWKAPKVTRKETGARIPLPEGEVRYWSFYGWCVSIKVRGVRSTAMGRYLDEREARIGAQEIARRIVAGRYAAEVWL